MRHLKFALAGAVAFGLIGCGERARLPASAGYGPKPALPEPVKTLVPTIDIAPAVGWKAGEAPTPAQGLKVAAFARGLDHPRWLFELPNGDVLVAETGAPERPADDAGLVGAVSSAVMDKAGAPGKSADRITLLRDGDGDGIAERRFVFLSHLHSPFGMALVGDAFYVADTDALLRFAYRDGETSIAEKGTRIVDLPAGPIDHHWTKNVIASPDGTKLYVSVGSNSNAGENGIAAEAGRAAIWRIDPATGAHRVFASGLRNPNGMAFRGAALWTVVNERDEIGSDLVPDYMTSVKDGAFYGWPYSYYGAHVDERAQPQRPDLVKRAIAPDYALGAHTASLGLAFARGDGLGPAFADGAFVSQHGSWNRDPPAGYRVIFAPFAGARPSGAPREVLTGFLDSKGRARGRPVGVIVDRSGALLVADDVGGIVWRVTRR